jgi:hypothetical protein
MALRLMNHQSPHHARSRYQTNESRLPLSRYEVAGTRPQLQARKLGPDGRLGAPELRRTLRQRS